MLMLTYVSGGVRAEAVSIMVKNIGKSRSGVFGINKYMSFPKQR